MVENDLEPILKVCHLSVYLCNPAPCTHCCGASALHFPQITECSARCQGFCVFVSWLLSLISSITPRFPFFFSLIPQFKNRNFISARSFFSWKHLWVNKGHIHKTWCKIEIFAYLTYLKKKKPANTVLNNTQTFHSFLQLSINRHQHVLLLNLFWMSCRLCYVRATYWSLMAHWEAD